MLPGSSPDGGRTVTAVANIACGAWPHAAAPSAAPSSKLRPRVAHPTAPPHNCLRVAAGHGQPFVAQPCAKQRPATAQQLRKDAGPSAGHRAASARSRARSCAAVDRQSGPRPESGFLRQSALEDLMDSDTDGKLLVAVIETSPITLRTDGDGAAEARRPCVRFERRGRRFWSLETRVVRF
ncbi:hypothetical protein F511_21298 [Dorcoceras hygrometricum]|uniref:Uncharacterized protein n=1 Tax=Dorcoceras hygrometricum TaxID=472368 RepID=A0A2Z7BKY0_9LAMI|nr:hypothetical protein F511_21298 [Dorcoceras hygrometricum]